MEESKGPPSAAWGEGPAGPRVKGGSRLDMKEKKSSLSLRAMWDSDMFSHAHTARIVSAAVGSSRGRTYLATTSGEGENVTRVWDLVSGKPLHRMAVHEREVTALRLVTANGRLLLVTASADGSARTYDAASGEELLVVVHGRTITCAEVLEVQVDRWVLLTGDSRGEIKMWNLTTGEREMTFADHKDSVSGMLMVAKGDKQLLVSVSHDRTGRIYNPLTGTNLYDMRGHKRRITCLAAGVVDPTILVTGSRDRTARSWSGTSGRGLHVFRGHTYPISCLAVAEVDGKDTLITGGVDTTVRVWSLLGGENLFKLAGHTEMVTALCCMYSAGVPVVVSGSLDSTCRTWNLRTGVMMRHLGGHTGPISSVATVALRNTKQLLVSASHDATARSWNPRSGLLQKEFRNVRRREVAFLLMDLLLLQIQIMALPFLSAAFNWSPLASPAKIVLPIFHLEFEVSIVVYLVQYSLAVIFTFAALAFIFNSNTVLERARQSAIEKSIRKARAAMGDVTGGEPPGVAEEERPSSRSASSRSGGWRSLSLASSIARFSQRVSKRVRGGAASAAAGDGVEGIEEGVLPGGDGGVAAEGKDGEEGGKEDGEQEEEEASSKWERMGALTIALGWIVATVGFLPLVRLFFTVFDCTRLADGGWLWDQDATGQTRCFEGSHLYALPFALLSIPLVIFVSVRMSIAGGNVRAVDKWFACPSTGSDVTRKVWMGPLARRPNSIIVDVSNSIFKVLLAFVTIVWTTRAIVLATVYLVTSMLMLAVAYWRPPFEHAQANNWVIGGRWLMVAVSLSGLATAILNDPTNLGPGISFWCELFLVPLLFTLWVKWRARNKVAPPAKEDGVDAGDDGDADGDDHVVAIASDGGEHGDEESKEAEGEEKKKEDDDGDAVRAAESA
eukprot:PLAT4774.1.p1 GENE.PLAT4774.1~~PLAT4774.1.p1  ORF type:complete len:900 (+),score=426.09 PLAT4774.1:126-2825(+)